MNAKDIGSAVNNYFNFKMSIPFSIFAGIVVYSINAVEHGWEEGIEAGAKQVVYVMAAGGFNARLCERVTNSFDEISKSKKFGTIVPLTAAFIMNYTWHKATGTKEPLLSAVWPILPNALLYYSMSSNYLGLAENIHPTIRRVLNIGRLENPPDFPQEQ